MTLFMLAYSTIAIAVFFWLTENTDEPLGSAAIRSVFWSAWLFAVCLIVLFESKGRA